MRGIVLALCAMVAACDFSAPEVTALTPDDNAQLIGIGLVDVHVEFTDSAETTVRHVATRDERDRR